MENEEFKLGKVVLLERYKGTKTKACKGKFKCFCGNEFITTIASINLGLTKSCGCYQKYKASRSNYIDRRSRTKLYRRFHAIKRRCYNKKDSSYPRYGGVGITICDEWLNDFNKFKEWAITNGYEDHLTIDRIKGALVYSPETCRWIPANKQSVNRGMFKNNKSGFRGVYRAQTVKEGWLAKINFQGKLYNLGTYNTKEEAALAYNKAAIKFHGTEARLNIIESSVDSSDKS